MTTTKRIPLELTRDGLPDPRQQQRALAARKARHAGLNDFIAERGGWLISIPGEPVMRFEARPGSSLPDELRGWGYVVRHVGETERIVPNETVEAIAAERSSMPPARVVHHAGITQTVVYELTAPVGQVSGQSGDWADERPRTAAAPALSGAAHGLAPTA